MFVVAAVVGFTLQRLNLRHGYLLSILATIVGVVFCIFCPVKERRIPIRNVVIVAVYFVIFSILLTTEFGQLEQLEVPDLAAIAARHAAMKKKLAFVGNDMTLGLVTLTAAAAILLSGDSYCLASFVPARLAGLKINMKEVRGILSTSFKQ